MAVPIFMTITGYVSAMKSDSKALRQLYSPREIVRKWLRFVIPFVPILVLEILIHIFFIGTPITEILSFIGVNGAYGPGSYYFPVMLQVVVMMPIISSVIQKYEFKGLLAFFFANVFFEAGKTLINMSPWIYRLCALRYIFILAYGSWLYSRQKNNECVKEKILYILAGFIGLAYIVLFEYMSFEPIITDQWTSTSVFAVLFIVPIMRLLMRPNKLHNGLAELLGRASFNIFLVQMVYYWLIYSYIPNSRLVINLIVCAGLGIAYYKLENPITKKIINRLCGVKGKAKE